MTTTPSEPRSTATASRDAGPMLLVVPNLRARVLSGGRVGITQKFIDGMSAYVERWPGPVHAWMAPASEASEHLDNRELDPAALPFGLGVGPFDASALAQLIGRASVVHVGVGHRTNHIARLCRSAGTASVYVAENTLKTKLQMLRADWPGPVVGARRALWLINQERRHRAAIRLADGVQCNGTPTHDAYAPINRSALLYFDTRVTADLLADDGAMRRRADRLRGGGPMRLVFTGRLAAIKGVDHLVDVAVALRGRGVAFDLTICGGGPMEGELKRRIAEAGLGGAVRLRGVLDFAGELVPMVRDEADVFVCCHRQGDPSCTYMETMSCGVPIAGYANEAFAGLARVSGAGWATPMDRPGALADRLAELDARREEVIDHARQSLAFAAGHTFEKTFARRIEHLRTVVRAHRAGSAVSA